MKSSTCGGAPTVFSLKSRRSLLRRPPVGGWYGAIRSTASRGLSAFVSESVRDSGSVSITGLVDTTNFHGARMRLQTFCSGERRDGRAQVLQGRWRELLNSDHLHKIGCGQAAPQTGDALRWEYVTRTGGIIAGGLGRIRAEKHSARISNFREQRGIVQAQMLGRHDV